MDDIDFQQSDFRPDYIYNTQRQDIQIRLLRIRIMLWAEDYRSAYNELLRIKDNYLWLILDALEVKKRLTSIYTKQKPTLESRLKIKGLKGVNLENIVQQEIADLSPLIDETEDALYIFSPVAAIVLSLDRRITEYLGVSTVIRKTWYRGEPINPDIPHLNYDEKTGFHYIIAENSSGNWGVKAYRLGEFQIDAKNFAIALQEGLTDTKIFDMTKQDTFIFPLWFRAFSQDAFIEITVYDQNRFMFNIISENDMFIQKTIHNILSSVMRISI